MFILDHKEFTTFDAPHRHFITITLPKCYYKKPVLKQKEAMDRLIHRFCGLFEVNRAQGCYELTKQSNIHAHMAGTIKMEDGFNENEQLILIRSILKHFPSIVNVQIIKNHDNVLNYILKDTKLTTQAFKQDAITYTQLSVYFRISPNVKPIFHEVAYQPSKNLDDATNQIFSKVAHCHVCKSHYIGQKCNSCGIKIINII